MSQEQSAAAEYDRQIGLASEQGSAQLAQQMSKRGIEERIQNPEFFREYTDPDLDSALHDWVREEFGPLASSAHVLGHRDEHYERKSEWLDLNKAERMIVESTPGRILREHLDVLRVFQGATHGTDKTMRQPMTQDEKRVVRDGMEVVTNRKSLSVGGKGSDALTTATSEHRQVRNEEEDVSTARGYLRKYIKG